MNGHTDDAPAAAPTSDARRRLADSLSRRNECLAKQDAARAAIRRLQGAHSLAPPIEAAIVALNADDAARMSAYAADPEAEMPAIDSAKREALVKALDSARASASAADRAIPGIEAAMTRETHRANELTHSINAAIAEIIREELASRLEEIVKLRAALAVKLARAQIGIDLALSTAEKIPAHVRTTIASAFYQNTAFEELRVRAASPPAPSLERYAGWHDLAARLASDANATVVGDQWP